MLKKLDIRVLFVLICIITITCIMYIYTYNYGTQHNMIYRRESLTEQPQSLRLDQTRNDKSKCVVWKSEKTIKFMQSTHKSDIFPSQFDKLPLCHFTRVSAFYSRQYMVLPDNCQETEIQHVINYALQCLNQIYGKEEQATYGTDTFVEGNYFGASDIDKHYDLYFKIILKNEKHNTIRKLILSKPINELHLISVQDMVDHDQKETINIIMPLQGRVSIFQFFIANFIEVCVKNDRHINLTVVYFGSPGYKEIKSIVETVGNEHNHTITLLFVNGTFSRGRGLHVGTRNYSNTKTPNPLLFFCDVDVIFTKYFFDRCRNYAVSNKQAYFPIIFGLYNPHNVYKFKGVALPPKLHQTVLSDETGYWIDRGTGMVCIYRNDYYKTGGFDLNVKGWGGEDGYLYVKYKSQSKIIRQADPSLFHIWHNKSCDTNLTKDKYGYCTRQFKRNEGPYITPGLNV